MEWNPRIGTLREDWTDTDMENFVLALRKTAEENQQDLDSRCYERNFTRTFERPAIIESSGGGFYIRTTLCLLIFCGFLWVKKENRSILGMAPDAVREAISQSVILQDIPNSDKMEKINP